MEANVISLPINYGAQRVPLSNKSQVDLVIVDKISSDIIIDVLAKSIAYKKVYGQDMPNQITDKMRMQCTKVTI